MVGRRVISVYLSRKVRRMHVGLGHDDPAPDRSRDAPGLPLWKVPIRIKLDDLEAALRRIHSAAW